MSSYPKPSPFPLLPIFNTSYFETSDFLSKTEASQLYLTKTNPVVSGNLTVAGSTSLQILQQNDIATFNDTATFNEAVMITDPNGTLQVNDICGSIFKSMLVGSSGLLSIANNTSQTYTINLPAGIPVAFPIFLFPVIRYSLGSSDDIHICYINNVTTSSFDITIFNKHSVHGFDFYVDYWCVSTI